MSLMQELLDAEKRKVLKCDTLGVPYESAKLHQDILWKMIVGNKADSIIIDEEKIDYREYTKNNVITLENELYDIMNIVPSTRDGKAERDLLYKQAIHNYSGAYEIYRCELYWETNNWKANEIGCYESENEAEDIDAICANLYIVHNNYEQIQDICILDNYIIYDKVVGRDMNGNYRSEKITVAKAVIGNKAVERELGRGNRLLTETASELEGKDKIRGMFNWDKGSNIITYTY